MSLSNAATAILAQQGQSVTLDGAAAEAIVSDFGFLPGPPAGWPTSDRFFYGQGHYAEFRFAGGGSDAPASAPEYDQTIVFAGESFDIRIVHSSPVTGADKMWHICMAVADQRGVGR